MGRQLCLQQGEQTEGSVLCSHSPREVRESFAEAVTFEVSPKEKQVVWDYMTVGEDMVPRRGDIKYKVLRPERAKGAQENTKNLGSAVARVSGLGGRRESMEGRVPGHESFKPAKELEICLSSKGVCVGGGTLKDFSQDNYVFFNELKLKSPQT